MRSRRPPRHRLRPGQFPGACAQRSQVVKAKRILRRCSARVRELVAAAAHAFPGGEEFSLEDLAAKINTDPGIQALTPEIRRHPKALTNLVGALVSWRRNLSRPEKGIGQVLLERVDDGETPARYRAVAAILPALAELNRPPAPANAEGIAPVGSGQ